LLRFFWGGRDRSGVMRSGCPAGTGFNDTIEFIVAGTGDQTKVGVALALSLADIYGDAAGCFDVTNAIVGNQIPTPGHGARRGVRR
jgi:hypothetical protein